MPYLNDIALNQIGLKSMRSGQPTIDILPSDTIANPNFPRTLVIDYGTTGIKDSVDGRVRKGKITASFDRRWHIVGATIVVKFINYAVSSNDGSTFINYAADSIVIKRNSLTSFTFDLINGRCSGDGFTILWATSRTFTQTGGSLTPNDYSDDVFETAGSSNGTDRNGKTFTERITAPIVKRTSCSWIESGRVEITPNGLSARTIDFGSGTCDNKASITIDGNSFSFNMN